jgi:SAM-dependent methyltransferase
MSTPSPYKDELRRAYDVDVDRRGAMTPASWQISTVDRFLESAQERGAKKIIELGCGTGQLAQYVADRGFDVTAIDLSPANVAETRKRGIASDVADFAALPFADDTFDTAFAMNSHLHVPSDELSIVLAEIDRVLAPGAPLLIVVWGGIAHEGVVDDEWLDPPRYFRFYTDDALLALETPGFAHTSFDALDVGDENVDGLHPQVLTLTAI